MDLVDRRREPVMAFLVEISADIEDVDEMFEEEVDDKDELVDELPSVS